MAEVRPDQLTDPTPCDEFDVATLMGHLVATVDRARVIGEGGDPTTVPLVAIAVDGDRCAAYRIAGERMWAVWSDDALLDVTVTAPWGRVPGRAAIWGYLNETLVHGWDLAAATGQPTETDSALAESALAVARRAIPASPRGGHVPFGAVVEPPRERDRRNASPTGPAGPASAGPRSPPDTRRRPARCCVRGVVVPVNLLGGATLGRRRRHRPAPRRASPAP